MMEKSDRGKGNTGATNLINSFGNNINNSSNGSNIMSNNNINNNNNIYLNSAANNSFGISSSIKNPNSSHQNDLFQTNSP
jgi:hypothetical protein